MTDLEKIKELFTSLGIGYQIDELPFGRIILLCAEGEAKIKGYSGFFTEFEFDKETGKFVEMGAGE